MTSHIPKYLARNSWDQWHLIQATILMALGFLVTWPAWTDIVHIGITDEESSQVLLAPVVAAWLVWVRRWRLRQIRPVHQWAGPLIIAVGWAMHSLGDTYLVQASWHAGAVIVVIGCLITIVGADVLRHFLPAFLVLALLVPVPGLIRQQIAQPLQSASAQFTQVVFEILGMGIERSGNVLTINGTQVAIAEACNGLRMVFALTLVSFAFAFGMPLKWYVRILVIGASPILAIIANGIRLVPTTYLYGYAELEVAETFHDVAGWLMLPLAFAALMAVIAILRWALLPVTQYTLAYD